MPHAPVSIVELRSLWNKNIINLDQKEATEAQTLLRKYSLQVTDIASPLFKTDWPGAPKSKYSRLHLDSGRITPMKNRRRFLSAPLPSAKPWERIGSGVLISGGSTTRTPIARQ